MTDPAPDPAAHPKPPPGADAAAPATQRGPDLLTLAAGLGALGIAATGLLGGIPWLPKLDTRWVLAGIALALGLLLVLGSLRPARGR
jgi:hypothetical protein